MRWGLNHWVRVRLDQCSTPKGAKHSVRLASDLFGGIRERESKIPGRRLVVLVVTSRKEDSSSRPISKSGHPVTPPRLNRLFRPNDENAPPPPSTTLSSRATLPETSTCFPKTWEPRTEPFRDQNALWGHALFQDLLPSVRSFRLELQVSKPCRAYGFRHSGILTKRMPPTIPNVHSHSLLTRQSPLKFFTDHSMTSRQDLLSLSLTCPSTRAPPQFLRRAWGWISMSQKIILCGDQIP